MTDTRLADISEFQESIDANAYLRGGYSCLIVRAHNGYRPDNLWPARRDYLRGFGFTALGWYQYVVADRDTRDQARAFISAVGELRGNEFAVCDLEEGSGAQRSRAQAWFTEVDNWQGFPATLYSGESFYKEHLGGADSWAGRPRWMAAYRSTEPTDPHELWQNTDSASFPGLAGGVDGNLFHGTASEFAQTMRAGSLYVPDPEGVCDLAVATKTDGGQEVFAETHAGQVWHRWNREGQPWSDWASLGTPGG
jgi:lysozyme